MGLSSNDTTDGPLCYDSVKPTVTPPKVSLRSNVQVSGSNVPVTITWSGSDATSGINHFTLEQSKDGGAWTKIATTTAATLNKTLAVGHTYRFRVNATDNAGNTCNVASGQTYTLSLLQENAKGITYSSGWTRGALTGANGGKVEYTSTKNKTATLKYTGYQVAWVSTQGSTRGSAKVSLDGGTAQTINTHSSTTKTAEVVDLLQKGQGAHTLVITVLGTSGSPRVDVDAFVILST
jgi:hypothetical protein